MQAPAIVDLDVTTFKAKPTPRFEPQIAVIEFENCCGCGIAFGFSGMYPTDDKYKTEFMVRDLKQAINEANSNGYGQLLAILNDYQKDDKGWGDIFKDNGFILLSESTNPNHDDDTTIYTYIRELNPYRFKILK